MSYIDSIKKDGENLIIEQYNGENLKVVNTGALSPIDRSSDIIRICFLDLETTGLIAKDSIPIEIAMKVVEFDKSSGKLIKAVAEYESYNDPGLSIESHITKLTGITDDMVRGENISWIEVEKLIELSQLTIAHNAKFDRAFIDKYIDVKTVWACSQKDIDWMERGFFKIGLEMLCMWHGFYFEAHRAMNDVNATINLIAHSSYNDNSPLIELISNSKKPIFRIVNNFPYNKDHINLIKSRSKKYYYDPNSKSWIIDINDPDDAENERVWLENNIYKGHFRWEIKKISIFDRYK